MLSAIPKPSSFRDLTIEMFLFIFFLDEKRCWLRPTLFTVTFLLLLLFFHLFKKE